MRKIIRTLNFATVMLAIHLLLLLCIVPYKAFVLPVSSNIRVAELDRAQVIDENALKDFNPDLARNLRFNLGKWITEKYARTFDRFWLCEVIFVIGGLVLALTVKRSLVVMERELKPESTGEAGRVGLKKHLTYMVASVLFLIVFILVCYCFGIF